MSWYSRCWVCYPETISMRRQDRDRMRQRITYQVEHPKRLTMLRWPFPNVSTGVYHHLPFLHPKWRYQQFTLYQTALTSLPSASLKNNTPESYDRLQAKRFQASQIWRRPRTRSGWFPVSQIRIFMLHPTHPSITLVCILRTKEQAHFMRRSSTKSSAYIYTKAVIFSRIHIHFLLYR